MPKRPTVAFQPFDVSMSASGPRRLVRRAKVAGYLRYYRRAGRTAAIAVVDPKQSSILYCRAVQYRVMLSPSLRRPRRSVTRCDENLFG
jgi:hypothetical protein